MTTAVADRRLVLTGRRVLLRRLQESDVGARYLAWMNDPLVTRFLESRLRRWTLDDLLRHVRADAENPAIRALAICLADGGRHIGNLRLSAIDPFHGNASLGIMIGERDCHGHGYGSEAIGIASRYAFLDCGVHRVTAGCYASNTASIAAFLKAGFREEGRLRSRWRDGDALVDGVILGLTRADSDAPREGL